LIPVAVAVANPNADTEPSPVVVTFSGNGGLPAAQTRDATPGDPYAVILEGLTAPTRTGFTFVGWYTAATGGSRVTGTTIVMQNVAHTLHARWEQNRAPVFRTDLTLTSIHYAYLVGAGGDRIDPGPITRAEAATVLLRMLSDESRRANWTRDNPFLDVPNNGGRWYSNAVSTVHRAGLLNGPSATHFAPTQHITRAEAAVVMTRFLDSSMQYQGAENRFTDIANSWARDAINLVGWLEWMTPDQNGRFNPDQNITRAEFAILANRVLGRTMDNIDSTTMRLWSDNTDRNTWFFNALQIATNSQPNAPVRNWVALQLPGAMPDHASRSL